MLSLKPLPVRLVRQLVRRQLTASSRAISALVFPWTCLVCGIEGDDLEGPFCEACRANLLATACALRSSTCPRCALPIGPFADLHGGCAACRGQSLGFDAALALGLYEHVIRDLCLRLKEEHQAWLAPWLVGLLSEARGCDFAVLPPDTWVVPVPLHWWRRLSRGYNQAEALAHHLARQLHLPLHLPLQRVRATDRLAHLGATDRRQAMRSAFRAHRESGLKGRTVLLVDDILTSGATAGSAARALKQAGARRIVVAVLARTL
jgi:ComF family protein